MAMSKRRGRTAPAATGRPAAHRREAARRARRRSLVALAFVAITVLALAGIVALALSRNSTVATATPTAVPTTAAVGGATGNGGPPNYGGVAPLQRIGILDNNAGLAQQGAAVQVGQPAPDFDWLTTNGPTRLSALRGHPVLIEFFAPWCGQCQQDVLLLNSLAGSPQFKGLRVLSITASPYGKDYETKGSEAPVTISDVSWFQRTYGAAYDFIFDPGNRVFNLFGRGQSYPTFFLIDAKGVVRFDTSTYIQAQDLIAHVMKVV